MTADELQAIKERCEKATCGPWENSIGFVLYKGEKISQIVADRINNGDDCRFIAHARTDIPDLLAEIENLLEDMGRIRECVNNTHLTPEELLYHIAEVVSHALEGATT